MRSRKHPEAFMATVFNSDNRIRAGRCISIMKGRQGDDKCFDRHDATDLMRPTAFPGRRLNDILRKLTTIAACLGLYLFGSWLPRAT